MDKDRIKGKAKELEGKVQIAKGKLIGSDSDKVKGTIKKVEGTIQNQFGKAKDETRKFVKND